MFCDPVTAYVVGAFATLIIALLGMSAIGVASIISAKKELT